MTISVDNHPRIGKEYDVVKETASDVLEPGDSIVPVDDDGADNVVVEYYSDGSDEPTHRVPWAESKFGACVQNKAIVEADRA